MKLKKLKQHLHNALSNAKAYLHFRAFNDFKTVSKKKDFMFIFKDVYGDNSADYIQLFVQECSIVYIGCKFYLVDKKSNYFCLKTLNKIISGCKNKGFFDVLLTCYRNIDVSSQDKIIHAYCKSSSECNCDIAFTKSDTLLFSEEEQKSINVEFEEDVLLSQKDSNVNSDNPSAGSDCELNNSYSIEENDERKKELYEMFLTLDSIIKRNGSGYKIIFIDIEKNLKGVLIGEDCHLSLECLLEILSTVKVEEGNRTYSYLKYFSEMAIAMSTLEESRDNKLLFFDKDKHHYYPVYGGGVGFLPNYRLSILDVERVIEYIKELPNKLPDAYSNVDIKQKERLAFWQRIHNILIK